MKMMLLMFLLVLLILINQSRNFLTDILIANYRDVKLTVNHHRVLLYCPGCFGTHAFE